MSWEAWATLSVIAICFAALSLTRIATDVVMLGGLLLLLLTGILTPSEALIGMSNEGMITIGMLYVVASGLTQTGAMTSVLPKLLGRPQSTGIAQLRLMAPVAAASAFLNNTPLVAMLIGSVSDWAKKNQVSPSKLMIPLSYAAIIGGTTTLIGTSTNLVVNGLLIKETGSSLGMFDIAVVGVPLAIGIILFIFLTSRWLLPNRVSVSTQLENSRSYIVEMLVDPNGALVGKTIEQAGLRHLPGLYLMEIERGTHSLPAVSPQERLAANDRLIFTGIVESVIDLQKIRGLSPATNQVFKLDTPTNDRCLIEAVVSDSCPLVGMTVREGRFRTTYNAAVIAVSRNGEQLKQKIGDIELRAGDVLMLLASPSFAEQRRNSSDFYLVSALENSQPPRHKKAGLALAILFTMVATVTFELTSMLIAAMVAAAAMLVFRCTSSRIARQSVDWQVLITIAASFGVGSALEKTGAAEHIAQQLTAFSPDSPLFSLIVIYVVTMLFTELITNNAAAVLMFPIAMATANALGVDHMPFVIAILFAASASFSTPIGYQTNLMVMGPGGYRFSDYFRAGIPMQILAAAISLTLIPLFWDF
ncbi:MAG: SLC13 family permease [Gammaproteobacteria bacterium]|nr:SLC13 family permease [Gammaproteobacteria bacterium]